jgi:hypothetical protein
MVNPLTGSQLQEMHRHYESQLQQIVSSMNLRKWIVEKNIGASVEYMEKLHTFIIAPSLEGIPPPPGETQ